MSAALEMDPEADAAPVASPARSAVPAVAMSASLVDSVEELQALAPEWATLNASARAGCLFLGPEWLIPWWKQFGAGRMLQVIALRERGALLGLLPIFAEQMRASGIAARRIAFLGDGATGCDYLDLLAAPGREGDALEAALHALFALPWDLCELDGLARESATALALAQRFPSGRKGAIAKGENEVVLRDAQLRFVCPHIPLRGTYDEYLAGFGRRENLKRREKWLAQKPGFAVEVARTEAEAKPALERFFELHRARWAVEGGSDGLADARHEEFHREAVAALARAGMLRLYTLWCARRPVASVYGAIQGKRFHYYQSGYDPLWASRSVGLVLLARTVKDAFAEGCSEFDFLRGDESYKMQWKRAERWTVRFQLFRGGRGRALRAALRAQKGVREVLKAAVPAEALSLMRVARRLLRAPQPEGESRVQALLRLAGAARDGWGKDDAGAASGRG